MEASHRFLSHTHSTLTVSKKCARKPVQENRIHGQSKKEGQDLVARSFRKKKIHACSD